MSSAGCKVCGKPPFKPDGEFCSREHFRQHIKAGQAERNGQYEEFERWWNEADAAGRAAGDSVVPEPMYPVEHSNPLDDNSPIVRRYAPVMDGVCGFAWVTTHPGNSRFALWAKKTKGATRAYSGGIQLLWVGLYGQSLTRKAAYANAFAEVLRGHGIKAYGQSRMD